MNEQEKRGLTKKKLLANEIRVNRKKNWKLLLLEFVLIKRFWPIGFLVTTMSGDIALSLMIINPWYH